jgi:hypothetical protein
MDEAISVASTTPTAARTATLGRHLRRLEFGDDGRRHEREPTATLSNNGPISEGSLGHDQLLESVRSLERRHTAAGFHYAYSCTNGSLGAFTYATAGTGASTTCSSYRSSPFSRMHSANFTAISRLVAFLLPPLLPVRVLAGVLEQPALIWAIMAGASRLHPWIVRRVGVHARATVIDGFGAQFVVPGFIAVDLA